MDSDRGALIQEYIKMYNNVSLKWINLTGFARFAIGKNSIEEKSVGSVIYGTCIIVLLNLLVIHILYSGVIRDTIIYKEEAFVVLQTNIMIHGFILNITFSNRNTGSDMIHSCISIDMILGTRETKFMRDIVTKINLIISLSIFNTTFAIIIALYIAFDVKFDLHITGSIFFILAFSIFYDFLFLLTQYTFLSMRIKYLNIALMKTSNVKLEYLPNIFLFDGLLWKDSFKSYVTFHKNTDLKQYERAFEMIYDHIQRIGKCYKFPILFASTSVLLTTLICIHTVFVVDDIELLRKICIIMLAVFAWILLMSVSLRSDMVLRQVEQTKIICIYAQLKPSNTGEVFKLTKILLKKMEVRDARPFIYGIFHFDSGMVLRLAASTFVYITFILQSQQLADNVGFSKSDQINSTIASL